MPKLDLTRALRIKGASGELAALKGSGFSWVRPSSGSTLKPGTLTNPGLGMMLDWAGPYNVVFNPFLDHLKQGTEWQASNGATWATMQAAGNITPEGQVNSLPSGASSVTMYALVQLPAVSGASGRYRLFYSGNGSISIGGASNINTAVASQIDFDYTANGGNQVGISINSPGSGTRLLALVHHDDLALYAAGEVFRPAWLDLIRNHRVLRFTDWMGVDYYGGSGLWSARYTPGRVTYQGGEGVPVEVMCALCNKIGADPWFSLITNCDDNYVTQFATVARAQLGSERRAYVEFSNKVWDGANGATADPVRAMAVNLFGDSGIEVCMEAYGGRSSQVWALWRAVWSGGDASRVRTVLQGWTPNSYVSEFAMTAPRWVALQAGRQAPHLSATDYALHANLDGSIRYDWIAGNVATVQGWIDTLTDSQIFDNMAASMRGQAVAGINRGGYDLAGLQTAYVDQKALITWYGNGMNPICYEGGSHLAVPPSRQGNARWQQVYADFHRSPQFASVWDDSIDDAWYAAFGPSSFYMRKNDIRKPDENNGYGLLRYLGDTSGNLQLAAWQTQQAVRAGETGRGENDFVGSYEVTAGAP